MCLCVLSSVNSFVSPGGVPGTRALMPLSCGDSPQGAKGGQAQFWKGVTEPGLGGVVITGAGRERGKGCCHWDLDGLKEPSRNTGKTKNLKGRKYECQIKRSP